MPDFIDILHQDPITLKDSCFFDKITERRKDERNSEPDTLVEPANSILEFETQMFPIFIIECILIGATKQTEDDLSSYQPENINQIETRLLLLLEEGQQILLGDSYYFRYHCFYILKAEKGMEQFPACFPLSIVTMNYIMSPY